MQHEPSPAAGIAAALGLQAEAVCRRYLPHGRKHGRYWVAGDLDGARGRSLFVRLGGPGLPGKWTDAATGEHGDLLDLIRHRTRAAAATRTPPKRRAACGGNAARSTAPTPSAICGRADSCNAASRRCASIPSFAIAKARRCAGFRRWSPPSPATTAPCSACSAPGSIRASPPRRAWLCPGRRSGGSSVMRCGSGPSPATASLRSSSARGSKRCSR